MPELSPQAQAVWNAYEELLENQCVVTKTDIKALAAALRAAAEQVVPEEELSVNSRGTIHWHRTIQRAETLDAFLSIAAELEAQ